MKTCWLTAALFESVNRFVLGNFFLTIRENNTAIQSGYILKNVAAI